MRALGFLAFLVVAFLVVIAVIALIDSRATGNHISKKKAKKLQSLVDQLENEATNALQVDQYDLTAHRVADLIRKTNRELNR